MHSHLKHSHYRSSYYTLVEVGLYLKALHPLSNLEIESYRILLNVTRSHIILITRNVDVDQVWKKVYDIFFWMLISNDFI